MGFWFSKCLAPYPISFQWFPLVKDQIRPQKWNMRKAQSSVQGHYIYIYIWCFVVVFSTDSKNVQPMQGEQFYRYLKLIDEYICRDYLFTYFCADLSVFQTFTIRLSWLRKETNISTKITHLGTEPISPGPLNREVFFVEDDDFPLPVEWGICYIPQNSSNSRACQRFSEKVNSSKKTLVFQVQTCC